jgi:PIN domain nuclease of toxin-antitoxin system
MNKHGILLDTHILLWLMEGTPEFSKNTLQIIEQAATKNSIFVSSISIWEISMLEAKGRIILSQPITDWVKQTLLSPGIQLAPLTPEISIESSNLPDNFHGDPADRIIVATARIENLMLITKDKKILAYGKHHCVSVLCP